MLEFKSLILRGDNMSSFSYKAYAAEVLREITKSDDKEIICKFINELCKISTLKQYEYYTTPKIRR